MRIEHSLIYCEFITFVSTSQACSCTLPTGIGPTSWMVLLTSC